MKENMKNRIRAYAEFAANMAVRKQSGGAASSVSAGSDGRSKRSAYGLGTGGGCLI